MNDNKKDFIEALRLLKEDLKEALPYIDQVHGRLHELNEFERLADDLPTEEQQSYDGLLDFYMSFPTWDDIEEQMDLTNEIREALEDDKERD